MNYYTYIDEDTDETIDLSVQDYYDRKIGDIVHLKGGKYKITGSVFTLGGGSAKFYARKLE
jgi:hypothetical protein